MAVKLDEPRSPIFRNLTIQEAKGKTIAFLSTYVPTKEWIFKRRETGHNPKFEGSVSYQMIPLTEIQNRQVQTNMTCGYFIKFEIVDMPCIGIGSDQHWKAADCQLGNGEGGPWQDIVATVSWGCQGGGGGGEGGTGNPGGDGTGEGGGGNTTPNYPEGYDPCASGEIKCNAPGGQPSAAQQLVAQLEITDAKQISFLDGNATLVTQLQNYLSANANSLDSENFARWAVAYLMVNADVDFETLSKNFAFNYEGGEEIYNENFWNNYASPQKSSPGLSAMLTAYPHQIYQGKRMSLTNKQIYALVGGQLNNKHLSGDPEYINACALRMSIALNKISGHEIPSSASSHTQNGKTYILGAQAMNSYLRKTYGTPSVSSVGNTKLLDNYTNITDAIKGKNAIYSIVYKNDPNLTGHIDMIVSGTVIGALNIPLSQNQPNKNKIQKIDIWFLN